ncbi:MAG TPA: dicarboxylate/amino acid:cation symporter [Phycisphaerales bacterium]|nr:dicarboxylate/amino acid:cation symporter [Phycisphaerales bacterium]
MAKQRLALHWKILIGLTLGVVVGVVLNQAWTAETWRSLGVGDSRTFLAGAAPADPAQDLNAGAGAAAGAVRFIVNLNRLAGDMFLRGLKFIAVPITLFALIVGVASLGDIRKLGRIGGKTLLLFLVTTVISISIGLGLSAAIRPGTFVPAEKREQLTAERADLAKNRITSANEQASKTTMWDQVLNIVPTNPFDALARSDMLQIVFLAVAVGIGLTLIGRERAEPVLKLCEGLSEAILQLVRILMSLAPYAVFALIIPIVAGTGFDVLRALAVYCVTVVGGLAIVLLVVYPLMLMVMTRGRARVTPGRFYNALSPAMLVAFSSSSSNATLPVTIECTRDRLKVSEEVSSFVCPLGATVNMNGTALYQAVATTFLAQIYGIDLSVADQLAIVTMATMSAIGTAGVPGASIVLLVMVLQAVHVPPDGIAIILAVDRILDMCRTVVNITGDAAVAAAVAATEGQLGAAGDPLGAGT